MSEAKVQDLAVNMFEGVSFEKALVLSSLHRIVHRIIHRINCRASSAKRCLQGSSAWLSLSGAALSSLLSLLIVRCGAA
jgi:hypothetical protein